MKKKMIHWSNSGIFLYGIATASLTSGQAITIDAPQGITMQGNNIDALQSVTINASQIHEI